MATKQEEEAEQQFFAGKLKEQQQEESKMEKHTKDSEQKEGTKEGYKDSLGQANPAIDMEKENIEAAKKRQENAEKAAKSEGTEKTGKAH